MGLMVIGEEGITDSVDVSFANSDEATKDVKDLDEHWFILLSNSDNGWYGSLM